MAVIQNHQADDDHLSRRIRADLRGKWNGAQDTTSDVEPAAESDGDAVRGRGVAWLVVVAVLMVGALCVLILHGN